MFEKILIFILFLGPLVFFHELGHFLFARLFGVRVEVFSIGFGPKLLKWKWGETQYALSLIPLGGYVKMFGDDPLNKDEIPLEERKFSFTHKGKMARFWIVMGGPLANFIMAFVIFFFLLVGGEKVPQIKIGKLETASVLYQKGLRTGDVVSAVNGNTVAGPSDIALEGGEGIKTLSVLRGEQVIDVNLGLGGQEFFEEYAKYPPYFRKPILVDDQGMTWGLMIKGKSPDLTLSLDDLEAFLPNQLTLFKLAKVDDEFVVAENLDLKDLGSFNNLTEVFSLSYRALDLAVDKTADKSAAELAGIQSGDVIISLNNKEVFAFDDLKRTLQESSEDKAQVGLWRNGQVVTLELVPEVKEVEGFKMKLIGVYSAGEYVAPTYTTSSPKGFFESIGGSFVRTWDSIVKTVEGFGLLLSGQVSLKSIGGPLAIGKVAHDSFKTSLTYFFQLMALISVNLGVINLFPIPVLDGGHILFIIIELFNRGPLSRRKMEIAQQVGLSVLLMLMIGAIFNDFSRLF
ncbi:MAG: hypothetical protein COW01_12500 [Bdellovibrionales bacterium CG12_big_fil_rev_8_21_14_0_65_38_15]|nr:MAG: hypothetical protein COW79_05685 [Bdellovibrionales bacterium CG22_combo_CG10-13_8_21_14_all_38_13]PIQ53964.1 MAG: hypothetical protein COW01_12500 [Bdellovibrionales bacterium CG12_big_fil_rev_8_21_14_0_65_38_15]PIR31004.1 MAG: hypothetical protein COV38_03080 [Bdellovibrionales bacterium CG11_big_fil_rev_8_21_14_0_20_38_13]